MKKRSTRADKFVKYWEEHLTPEDLNENMKTKIVDSERKRFVEECDERIKRNFLVDNVNYLVYSSSKNSN